MIPYKHNLSSNINNNNNHNNMKSTPGSVGLVNLGNSCYMNCILQCLMNADPLTQYFQQQIQTQIQTKTSDTDSDSDSDSDDTDSDSNSNASCFKKSSQNLLQQVEEAMSLMDINKTNPLGSGGIVVSAYVSLLQDIWSGRHATITPNAFKASFAAYATDFNNTQQHDAQEFALSLLDVLHEDLNRVMKQKNKDMENISSGTSTSTNSNANAQQGNVNMNVNEMPTRTKIKDTDSISGMDDAQKALNTWKFHLQSNDSIIVDRFQGMHRTSLTCPHCSKQSSKFDVYSSLSLTILPPKDYNQTNVPITLESCLEHFTRRETLDDSNLWFCTQCKAHVNAIKRIQLWTAPDVLLVHLKRFTYMTNRSGRRTSIQAKVGLGNGYAHAGGAHAQRVKIEDVVDYGETLNLEPFLCKDGVFDESSGGGGGDGGAQPIYKLFGVVEHSGITANSGHYTATVENSKEKRWYRCNDSQIGESTVYDAKKTNGAYLLFYKRAQGGAKWAGMDKVIEFGTRGYMNMKKAAKTDEDGFTAVVPRKGRKKKR